MSSNKYLTIAAFFGAAAVAIGAFGAHGLKAIVSADRLGIYETGVDYHFYHALALLAVGWMYRAAPSKWLSWSASCFIIGILLFSGSLYLLATRSVLGIEGWWFLGPLTPIGGVFFILGWVLLGWAFWRNE
ncbi:MAG: DUF423 domain-containing protein [Saprospiraceae bacterium]